MDGETSDIGYLLTAYADGALSGDGVAWVEQQLATSAALRARLGEIRRIRAALGDAPPAAPSTLAPARLDALLSAARVGRGERRVRQRAALSRPSWRTRLAVAALLLVAIGGFVVLSSTVVAHRTIQEEEAPPVRFTLALPPAPAPKAAPDVLPTTVDEELRDVPADSVTSDLDVSERADGMMAKEEESPNDGGAFMAIAAGKDDQGFRGRRAKALRESRMESAAPPTTHRGAFGYASQSEGEGAFAGAVGGSVRYGGAMASRRVPAGRAKAAPPKFPFDDGREGDATRALGGLARLDAIDQPSSSDGGEGSASTESLKKTRADTTHFASAPPTSPANAKPSPTAQPVANGDPSGALMRLPAARVDLAAQLAQPTRFAWSGDVATFAAQVAPSLGLPITPPAAAVRASHLAVLTGRPLGTALIDAARAAGAQLRLTAGQVEFVVPGAALDATTPTGIDAEAFRAAFGTRPMTATAEDPQSTFALDQDTASFALAKARLQAGQAPDPAAIQPEQFVNAMPMDYPTAIGAEAFALFAEGGPSPFAAGANAERTCTVAIGVVARAPEAGERRPLHLTLAIDCSGSMAQPGALDAVKAGLAALLPALRAQDRVGIVAFGDQARVVLPATPGDQRAELAAAIDALTPGGGTNLAEGLEVAYRLAAEDGEPACEHRVLVASDGASLDAAQAGDFAARAQGWRRQGITLIALGCGRDQVHEQALQALADHADGQHFHVADAASARELFTGTLVPARLNVLARDAKVQVTWDPRRVSHFRLIGFEDRRLAHRDFRDDAVDAGELAEASQATALYEIVLVDGASGPLGTASMRYLDTRRGTVRELSCPLPATLIAARPSPRLELAACAAEFAELLQRGWWANARCATFARLRARLAQCQHPAAGDILALVDRAIAIGLKP